MSTLTPALLLLSALATTPVPAAPSAAAAPDTTIAARRGDRLTLESFAGHIVVRGGPGDMVHVSPGRSDAGVIAALRDGDRIVLAVRDRKDRSLERHLTVVVPVWLDVDLRGSRLDVSVAGLRSDVFIRTGEGDIHVEDVEGTITLGTVEGDVTVTDARGSVRARSVDESVRLTRVTGTVDVESTDGDVILERIDASEVQARSVDGDVDFEGQVHPGGTIRLVTHNGDIVAALPQGTDVEVTVSTFDGSFAADFPVRLQRFHGGAETSFTLGRGGSRLDLQAFDGDIRLRYSGR